MNQTGSSQEGQGSRVRTSFRILGWLLGPLFMVAGIGVLVAAAFTPPRLALAATGIGALGFGILAVRAAYAGRDPYRQW
jgi:uncharacterized membrane protein